MSTVCPTPAVCPACGQPIMIRRGVRLGRVPLALFDMIERRPDGVAAEELARLLYPGAATPIAVRVVRSHINQINDRLAETDWRIVNRHDLEHGRRYFLVEEKTP